MSMFKQLFWNTVPFLHQKEKLFTSFTFFGTLFSFKCRQPQSKLAAWLITNPVFADFSLVFAFLPGEVTSCKNVLDAGIYSQGQCSVQLQPLPLAMALCFFLMIWDQSLLWLPEPGFLCRALAECPQHQGTSPVIFPEHFKTKRGLKNQIAQGKTVEGQQQGVLFNAAFSHQPFYCMFYLARGRDYISFYFMCMLFWLESCDQILIWLI